MTERARELIEKALETGEKQTLSKQETRELFSEFRKENAESIKEHQEWVKANRIAAAQAQNIIVD